MIRNIFLFCLTSLFTSLNLVSQTERLDSIHHNKVSFYRNSNVDSLLFYIDKLEKSNNICRKTEALTAKAYVFYRQKDYSASEKIITVALSKINTLLKAEKSACLIDRKIAALNRLFWIKKNQEEYEQAYMTLIKCENEIVNYPYKNQKNFRDNLGLVLNKASIQNRLTNPEKALTILRKALSQKDATIIKDIKTDTYYKQWNANILNNFGNSFMEMNDKHNNSTYIDSAAIYYKKAYLVTKTFVPLHKDSEIIYALRKTKILIAKKKYTEAIKEINNYSKISNGFNYLHRKYYQKAICFSHLNKPDSAIHNAKKLIYSKIHKCRSSKLITMYDILTKQYNSINKIDSAYKYSQLTLKQFNLARDNKEKILNLSYKNDFDKVKLLNENIKSRETKKQNHFILITISLFFIVITLIYLFKFKKEKVVKNKATTIINDKKNIEKEVVTEKKAYNIDEALEQKIIDEIDKIDANLHFLNPNFSITTITDAINTNSTYVSFIFNKHHNETFKQYYTRLKIEYIVKQLKTNKTYRLYSIQALAEETGYTNASAFARAFKKQMNTTPSVFIKALED